MNKKGQALVEFVIILPIFLLLVLGMVDIGNIIYSKTILEEQISDAVEIYQRGKSFEDIKNELKLNKKYDLKLEEDGEYTTFLLTKKIDIITPGLQLIFDDPYMVSIKRSIINE